LVLSVSLLLATSGAVAGLERRAFFGDLHVHTRLSFDAYLCGTLATPDDAYRYARGEALEHPSGFRIQLDRPLDFYAVTDHAEHLGMLEAMEDPRQPVSQLPEAKRYTQARTLRERFAAFQSRAYVAEHLDLDVVRSAWRRTIAAAERHYRPGEFTTFVGYEYTSGPGGNLHRNVIFRGAAAPDVPFSALDSLNPEDLWDWLDDLRKRGIEALAIPHNSNGSNGLMFALVDFAGEPLDADWAEQRMRNEPLVEITQTKGTSEAHPFLSPNDEWADFEIYPYRIGSWEKSVPRGSYVREAYLNGLVLEEERGFNPYRFGVVGASDTHVGGGSFDESSFFSKVGVIDGTPQRRGSVPIDPAGEGPQQVSLEAAWTEGYFRLWGASGLTGVWAQENTREAIYDALRRKETFATSGPRIRVRFFAGYDLPDDLTSRADMVDAAYASGVPMGGDVAGRQKGQPRFLVWAMKDAEGAPLQRLQVVKGWLEDGRPQERVYDVACSDGLVVEASSHRCPDNGAKVKLEDCSITAGVGAAELVALWQDPDFDPEGRAFYYLRVLENPTCRWSTWDAVRAGTPRRPDLAATLQERAWSSPIWFLPAD
jgi:hypothetical protein